MNNTKMTYREVIEKIGKMKGDRKYGEAMCGAMLPRGKVYDYEVLALLYDMPQDFVIQDLDEEKDKVFDSKFKRK